MFASFPAKMHKHKGAISHNCIKSQIQVCCCCCWNPGWAHEWHERLSLLQQPLHAVHSVPLKTILHSHYLPQLFLGLWQDMNKLLFSTGEAVNCKLGPASVHTTRAPDQIPMGYCNSLAESWENDIRKERAVSWGRENGLLSWGDMSEMQLSKQY